MTKGLQSRYFNLREEEHQMNSDLDELSCSQLHFIQSAMLLMQLVETDRRCWTPMELGRQKPPRQHKFRAMNGAHLASPIRRELGYAHWPQLGTQYLLPYWAPNLGPIRETRCLP